MRVMVYDSHFSKPFTEFIYHCQQSTVVIWPEQMRKTLVLGVRPVFRAEILIKKKVD